MRLALVKKSSSVTVPDCKLVSGGGALTDGTTATGLVIGCAGAVEIAPIATGLVDVTVGAFSSIPTVARRVLHTSSAMTTTAATITPTTIAIIPFPARMAAAVLHANPVDVPGSHWPSAAARSGESHVMLQFTAPRKHSDRPGRQSWHSVEAFRLANRPMGHSSQLEDDSVLAAHPAMQSMQDVREPSSYRPEEQLWQYDDPELA